MLFRVILFDSHNTGPGCCHEDKLAVIGEVWGKCVEGQPLIYIPSPNVTVTEHLVAFGGHCPFKQYVPSKQSKYSIKKWATYEI